MDFDLNGMLNSISAGGINVAVAIIIIVIFGGFVFLVFYLYATQIKRYDEFRIVVWGKDGFGHPTEEYDQGGIFTDKETLNKRLFLKKNKIGMNADKIPYILQSNGQKIVYLLRTGLKNFSYVRLDLSADVKLEVGEEDVNWAVNTYERQKKVFSNNTLMQYLPYISLGVVAIIIMVIFIYFFKDFGVLKEMATELHAAADAIAQAKAGTVVLN